MNISTNLPCTNYFKEEEADHTAFDASILARQPIMDHKNRLFGYELLFRKSNDYQTTVCNDVAATAVVLSNALNQIGVENILGKSLGFINVENSVIHSNYLTTLPKEKFIFEILEKTIIDDKLLEEVKNLTEQGYRFALDDYTHTTANAEYFRPLFPYISILKVDITLNTKLQVCGTKKLAAEFKMKLLAEKVETRDEYEFCNSLGFSYFQGYYFARPSILKARSIDPLLRNIFVLINLLRREADMPAIEAQFRSDPELTFNLLRFINSSALGIRNRITSINQAVSMVGSRKLLNWLLLMVYSGTGARKSRKPLFAYVALRAKLMSLLAASLKTNREEKKQISEEAFFIGMLSLFDLLLHSPLTRILPELNLPIEIYNAIFFKKGDLGMLLATVIAAETGDQENLLKYISYLDLDIKSINASLLQGAIWVNETAQSI